IVPVETLKATPQITLQPLGKVTGVLKRPSGPGTNEDLDLAFTEKNARGLPQINLNIHAVTDSEGRFAFDGVPAAHLQLSYRIAMQRSSWQNSPLQEIDVQPGQTLDLKVDAPDRSTSTGPEGFSYGPPAPPKRVAGAEVKGLVLSPSGQPAADVDV